MDQYRNQMRMKQKIVKWTYFRDYGYGLFNLEIRERGRGTFFETLIYLKKSKQYLIIHGLEDS